MKTLFSGSIIAYNLPASKQFVFVGYKPLQSHRASGVDFSGADADLCAESIAEAVGETGRTVLIYSGGICELHEFQGIFLIFRKDAVGVVGAEPVNMSNGFLQAVHQFHRKNQV